MGSTHLGDQHGAAELAASDLRTTVAIRERAVQLLNRARAGESGWFIVDDGFLETAATEIVKVARDRYPRNHIKIHSRWRHFEAGGVDRRAQLTQRLAGMTNAAKAHILMDLTIVSVLLDGGAGPDWKYTETATGAKFTRSEGLGLASWHAFMGGMFSSDKNRPLQVDSKALRSLPTERLAEVFQVTETNPLVGLEDRAILLRRFGEVMEEAPEVFGDEVMRPSGIFDEMISPLGPDVPPTADVAAHDILSQLLTSLQGIWPASNYIGHVPLGDCWRHSAVRGEGLTDGWVPFHKLSQWMTYSLLEPFEWSGVKVRDVHMLTALPEYRNGGLMLDSGLLRLRDEQAAQQTWQVGDEIIVEWRALTVALMDEVADAVRKKMHMDDHHMPLAKVLEGGSWAAGRALAEKHRGGLPPLKVVSDGTVF
ncbi:MAG TPA: URC4/urg3 family protein [Ramlibacter sp.]|nr:URC4/urg3 family protein [Ramlibacter sp.]